MFATILIALGLLSTPAIAQSFSGAYFCAEEAVGGLSYDDTRKAWQSTRFTARNKFVLRMKFERIVKDKDSLGDMTFEGYTATLTNAGKNDIERCG